MSLRVPRALEQEWYARLASDGFQDIEDVHNPARPLKDWHSFRFPSEQANERRERNQEYQKRIEGFFQSHSFTEISALVVKHGNSKISVQEVRRVVELHCEGQTEREIARTLRRSKTCIHKVITRVRAWMKLA